MANERYEWVYDWTTKRSVTRARVDRSGFRPVAVWRDAEVGSPSFLSNHHQAHHQAAKMSNLFAAPSPSSEEDLKYDQAEFKWLERGSVLLDLQ